jgi:hypothetical protein
VNSSHMPDTCPQDGRCPAQMGARSLCHENTYSTASSSRTSESIGYPENPYTDEPQGERASSATLAHSSRTWTNDYLTRFMREMHVRTNL